MRRLALLAVLAALALPAASAADEAPTVFAASSLTGVFRDLGGARFSFAGSNELAAQIRRGAPADVFASADPELTQALYADGLVERPVAFASNRLVVVVPRSNPARLRSVYDLARRRVRLVVGAPSVPVGGYARDLLRRLRLGRALASVVSEEPDVKSVVAKVALGEADAGIVYLTDVKPVAARVATLAVPRWAQPRVRYEIAVVRQSRNPAAAAAFVRLVTADARGRAALVRAGFGLP